MRVRWWGVLAASISLFAFLIYGETRGGAPTHHPERALVAVAWLLVILGVDAVVTVGEKIPKKVAASLGALALVAWAVALPSRYEDAPGRGEDENREPQIARGADLRARDVKHLSVVPCAYEHFALIAAFGAPENVDIANVSPHDAAARRPDATCPRVTEN